MKIRSGRAPNEWLERHLPASTRVIVSPAIRARETAEALSRDLHTDERVRTGASPEHVLKAAGWPDAGDRTVGHITGAPAPEPPPADRYGVPAAPPGGLPARRRRLRP